MLREKQVAVPVGRPGPEFEITATVHRVDRGWLGKRAIDKYRGGLQHGGTA
jgi:hypothetical protein